MAPNYLHALLSISHDSQIICIQLKWYAYDLIIWIKLPCLYVKSTNHRAPWGNTPLQEPIRSKRYFINVLQTYQKGWTRLRILSNSTQFILEKQTIVYTVLTNYTAQFGVQKKSAVHRFPRNNRGVLKLLTRYPLCPADIYTPDCKYNFGKNWHKF